MDVGRTIQCCGIREIGQLSSHATSEEALEAFRDKASFPYESRWRYAIFSQAGKANSYGEAFAAFILDNKLGEVIESGFHTNPNSGNPLKVWIWTVNWSKVKAYGKPKRVRKPSIKAMREAVKAVLGRG